MPISGPAAGGVVVKRATLRRTAGTDQVFSGVPAPLRFVSGDFVFNEDSLFSVDGSYQVHMPAGFNGIFMVGRVHWLDDGAGNRQLQLSTPIKEFDSHHVAANTVATAGSWQFNTVWMHNPTMEAQFVYFGLRQNSGVTVNIAGDLDIVCYRF